MSSMYLFPETPLTFKLLVKTQYSLDENYNL